MFVLRLEGYVVYCLEGVYIKREIESRLDVPCDRSARIASGECLE